MCDVSRHGCYIEIDHPLPVGTEVQLRLTIADTSLEIGAKVAFTTPMVGMGMQFVAASPVEENQLAQILERVTGVSHSPAGQQAERPQPGSATVQITREAAPEILAKIIRHINGKGVLTRQELADIVKAVSTNLLSK